MIKSVFLPFKSTVRELNSRGIVVTAPSVLHKYNETTVGVDLGDQLLLNMETQFKWKNYGKKSSLNTGIQRVVIFVKCKRVGYYATDFFEMFL